MKNSATSNPYAEWFERLRAEYGEQLNNMPLPDGLPEHLHELVASGDEEALLFMVKLAWQFGAQVGYASAQQQGATAQPHRANVQA